MRNQKRKLIPDIFMCYRAYLDRLISENKNELYDKSYLFIHTTYPEVGGWDIPSLLIEHKLADKVYFTSICSGCSGVFATKFHENVGTCPSCKEHKLYHCGTSYPIPTEVLAKIYQSFDLFLQVAICEGFGMPQVEAAACGIPIASVNYSAMTEIVRNLEGYPIPVKTLFRELETGANRAYPDHDALIDILYKHHVLTTEEQKQNMSQNTRKLCEKYYSWEQVTNVWDEALSSVDISTNEKWDAPSRKPDSVKVPPNLDEYSFVKFILDNIIKEPWMINTSNILKLIRDLCNGYDKSGKKPMNHQLAKLQLENLLKSKISTDTLRTAENPQLFQEPFLNV
jgi:hypothetical protein